jgi:hypothetical protein
MKWLMIGLLTLGLALGACASETTNADMGAAISDLASQAQDLVNDSDLDAQLVNAVQVVADNATTVGLAAAGGEVSDADLDSLTGALDDYENQVSAVRDSLDPDVEEQLDTLASDLRDAIDQLTS